MSVLAQASNKRGNYMDVRRRDDGRIERSEFKPAVIKALRDLGGRARAKEVINRVEKTLPLTDADYERYGGTNYSPNPYFQDMCHRARRELVDDGVLLPEEEAGRGWWQFDTSVISRESMGKFQQLATSVSSYATM